MDAKEMIQAELYPITNIEIPQDWSLAAAINQLDRCKSTLTLVVVNEAGRVVGTLTDGDVRRWLLRQSGTVDLQVARVKDVMCGNPIVAKHGESWFQKITQAREVEKSRQCRIRIIPIVDRDGRLTDVLDLVVTKQRSRLDAVLMAKAKTENNRYYPCKTNEDIERRRVAYDTIRYRNQMAKYEALSDFANTRIELNSIQENRRIDELYSSLRRGADWTALVMAPDARLQEKVGNLERKLREAKKTVLTYYITNSLALDSVGSQEAYDEPDIVFVLGCASQAEEAARVLAAEAYLARLKAAPSWLVLSGGGRNPAQTEARRMKECFSRWFLSRFQEKLILEEDSLDTVGNAVLGWLSLLQQLDPTSDSAESLRRSKIAVVTTDYHALRALDLFTRVFNSRKICVVIVPGVPSDIEAKVRLAESQLDSESRANRETFSLDSVTTGSAENISDGHIKSMLYQLIRHHDMYKWRFDIIRKYRKILAAGLSRQRNKRQKMRRNRKAYSKT
ncbi:MAG: ElyC/SanA/YdcF family protein [Thermoanaerobaculia bacterium]|nr:ElyC/SanA/YdcF family protein [Thermoanaerobaculia bacterium]